MKQTAEEFYKDYCNKRITIGSLNGHERLEVMIEFAKLHIADIDYRLSIIEDYANGEAGVEITKLRKYISETYGE